MMDRAQNSPAAQARSEPKGTGELTIKWYYGIGIFDGKDVMDRVRRMRQRAIEQLDSLNTPVA